MTDILEPSEITEIVPDEIVAAPEVSAKAAELTESVDGPAPWGGIMAIGHSVTYGGTTYVFANPINHATIKFDKKGYPIVNKLAFKKWSKTEINNA